DGDWKSLVIRCLVNGEVDTILCDPKQMSRAISNLIQNSICYANNSVLLTSKVEKDYWVLTVDDDGPGVPAEFRKKVLEPFYRPDASRQRSSGGHGLGLSIVNHIVKLHGETLSIEDSPMYGARFRVSVPLSQPVKK
ncbi:two-component sensor histidine kinase, partial [Veronia nyctiphanis]